MGGPEIGVTIPAIFIEGPDGDALNAAVTAAPGLTVTMHCEGAPLGLPNPCAGGGLTLVDSGDVYHSDTANNQLCAWTLVCTGDGAMPELTFTDFAIEAGWDYLYLYDASSSDGPADVTLHGNTVPGPQTATGSVMVAEYDSDGSVNGAGFGATFACVTTPAPPPPPDPCTTGIEMTDAGTITQGAYDNNMDCRWTATCSNPAEFPTFTFSSFQTEGGWDFLYIYSGSDMSVSPAATLHGSSLPDPITGDTPVMTARFMSDGSVTSGGFEIAVTCAEPEPAGDCTNNELVVDYTGGFHASGHAVFGAQVVNSADFAVTTVVISDPLDGCVGDEAAGEASATGLTNAADMPGKIALVRRGVCYFTTKVMNAQNAGAVAAIVYNDHRDGTVTMGGPEIGVTIPSVFILGSEGDALNAAVTADPTIVVNIHCASETNFPPDPCGDGVTLVDSGDVFLGGLGNHQQCTWAMSCSDAALVPALTFDTFAIEAGWDFLYLFDAADTSGSAGLTLHGSMGSASAPVGSEAITIATGPVMVALYDSDGSVNGQGFTATFSCIEAIPIADCTNEDLVVDWAGGFHASGHAVFGATAVFSSDLSEVNVVPADPLDGCVGDEAAGEASPTGLTNAGDMPGKVALIRRGVCYFTTKVMNAQNAGAVAAIVYNDHRAGFVTMGGPEIGVTIPSVFILGSDGDALNAAVTADPGMIVSVHCGPESLHMPDPCGAGGITGVDSGQIILGGLENNQLCSWGATCSLDTDVITVTFSAFDIESNWDFLRVYQSADASGDPVASLTGSLPAGSAWTSDGPSASAVYDSDGSVNGPGIVGAWACAPPPPPPSACTASGGVTLGDGDEMLMPPPGESMASNQQCTWTVVCPDGTAPQVTFSAFNIEANWDFLYVDSTGDGAANAQLTGNSIPDVITGSASSNVYMYDSDGSVNRDGFTATVACAAAAPPPPPDPCSGGMALSPGDTFSSPNYPSNYQSNRNCQWTMDCPTGTPTVTFSAFNLENNWDFMHFDLSGNGAADASLTGSDIPDPVTGSAGTQALAVFMSDGSVNRPGFEATFTCPPAPPPATTQPGITFQHCLPGAGMIETEAECIAAATAVGAPYASAAGTEWASGCLFHGGNVYYSTHDDTSAQDPTDAYICNP